MDSNNDLNNIEESSETSKKDIQNKDVDLKKLITKVDNRVKTKVNRIKILRMLQIQKDTILKIMN
jgi:hypothetical protein